MNETRGSRAWDPALAAILALAGALRIALLAAHPRFPGAGDETLHYALAGVARHLGSGVFGFWAPLYDALLAGVFALAGPDPFAVRVVQTGLSTLAVGLTYGIARAAGGLWAGRVAGLLAALEPSLLGYGLLLYSETLFLTLLAAATLVLFRSGGVPRRGDALLGGALLGLAVLTRSVLLYFLPLWLAWSWLRGRREETRGAALALLAAAAVVLPWTVRNAIEHHGFVPVDATLGTTAFFAFNTTNLNRDLGFVDAEQPPPDRQPCAPQPAPWRGPLPAARSLTLQLPPEAARFVGSEAELLRRVVQVRSAALQDLPAMQRCELRAGLDFARRHPDVVLGHLPRRLYAFWGPNSFVLRGVAMEQFGAGPLGKERYGAWKLAVVAAHAVALGAFLMALGRRDPPPLVRWTALLTVYYTTMHVLAVSYSRYRLPLMPLLLAVGALWLARPTLPEGRARRVGVFVLLAAATLTGTHYALVRLP